MSKRLQTQTKTEPTPTTSGAPGLTDVRRDRPVGDELLAVLAEQYQGSVSAARRHFAVENSQLQPAVAKVSISGSSPTPEPAFGHNFGRIKLHGRVPQRIQTKAEVRQPEDEYEREADLAASQVMHSFLPQVLEGSLRAELSHSGPMIQRQALESQSPETGEAAPAGLIVEDDAQEIGPGQMRKSEFLEELRSSVCATADAELAAADRSTQACPYLEKWFGFYSTRSGPQVERAIRKYAPETEGAKAARDYIPPVQERVRRGVARWAVTGEITGVPEELASQIPEAGVPGAVGGPASGVAGGGGQAASGAGSMLFKARAGGTIKAEPQAIRSQLGAGKPLDSSVKSRIESAYGHNFSRVRVHTDARAVELCTDLNARAFTVGTDIAFAESEYQPGTLIGDALIAHELAHVVQQEGGSGPVQPVETTDANRGTLEEDADNSAISAVVSLWAGAKGVMTKIARNGMPCLKSGLRLQRCTSPGPLVVVAPLESFEFQKVSDNWQVACFTQIFYGPGWQITCPVEIGAPLENHLGPVDPSFAQFEAYQSNYLATHGVHGATSLEPVRPPSVTFCKAYQAAMERALEIAIPGAKVTKFFRYCKPEPIRAKVGPQVRI
jgi:hypothetical protein